MKKKIISFIVALALAATATFGFLPSLYENSGESESEFESEPIPVQNDLIEINEENFPDENFRSVVAELEESVAENEAADGILSESEIALITSISVSSMSVKDLKGIEFFTALEVLDCSDNGIEALDLSSNTNLKELYCSQNDLHELDLSGLQQLTKLDCGYNSLSELILDQNPMLTDLHLSGNPVTELDLSGNPDLWRFEASYTQLTSLTVENHNPYDSENGMEFEQFELNGSLYTVSSCAYDGLGFDLASLPGSFDAEKVIEWNDIQHEGTVLTDVKAGDTITYTYEIINGISAEFSIAFTAASHSLTKVEDISSLCTTAAELWQCTECGGFFADENGEIEAEASDSHSFTENVELEPTCTTEGLAVKICDVCGYEEHEVLCMLPHEAGEEYTFDDACHMKTCITCGQEMDREKHVFDEGSNICSICGAELNHIHSVEYIEEKAPTCTEEGVRAHYFCAGCGKCFGDSELIFELNPVDLIIEKIDHQYELTCDETGHWEQCIICEEKKEEPAAHEFESERTEPSCYLEGSVTSICSVCGYSTVSEVLPATGEHSFGSEYDSDSDSHWLSCTTEGCTEKKQQSEHSYTKLEIIKNPTCAEEGIIAHICEVCGHRKNETTEVLDKHTYDDLYCQLDENTHAKLCTVCGKPAEAEAHVLDQGTVIKEATCENGIIRYTCVCGYTKDAEVPAESGHSFAGSYEDLGDTHSAVCSVCGASGEPEEHDYNIEIVYPNCVESGKMIYTCKHCGHSYSETKGEPTGIHVFASEFTLDGDKHRHKCKAEGCTAVDIHNADECSYAEENPPAADTSNAENTPSESEGSGSDDPLVEVPTINVTWPTTAGIVLNPYKMKIKMTLSSDGNKPIISEDPNGKGETVLSNELAFINNGDCEVNVSVTGSVYAVSTVDSNGNVLLDGQGNPATTPSSLITIATAPIKQPEWNAGGTDIVEGDRRNSVFIYLEASDQLDSTGTQGIYSGEYDSSNKNQMVLSTGETTKELFGISAKNGDKAGVTNLKIFGDISTDPAVNWGVVAKTDRVKVSLVFSASLAEPLPEKPLTEETPEESSETLPEETPDEASENIPEDALEGSPENTPEDILQESSENMPEDASEEFPENMLEEALQEPLENTPEESYTNPF